MSAVPLTDEDIVNAKRLSDLLETGEKTVARARPIGPARRTYWCSYKRGAKGAFTGFQKAVYQASKPADNFLVSSLCESGLHAPALDIDFGLRAVKKKGKILLIFQHALSMESVLRLGRAFVRAGIMRNDDFADILPARGLALSDQIEFVEPKLMSRVPTRIVPSSTKGHHHLYLDIQMPWDEYRLLLAALYEAKFINKKWFDMVVELKMTTLIRPGQDKTKVKARIKRPKKRPRKRRSYRRSVTDYEMGS